MITLLVKDESQCLEIISLKLYMEQFRLACTPHCIFSSEFHSVKSFTVILVSNIVSLLEAQRTKGQRKKACILIIYDFDSSRKPK